VELKDVQLREEISEELRTTDWRKKEVWLGWLGKERQRMKQETQRTGRKCDPPGTLIQYAKQVTKLQTRSVSAVQFSVSSNTRAEVVKLAERLG